MAGGRTYGQKAEAACLMGWGGFGEGGEGEEGEEGGGGGGTGLGGWGWGVSKDASSGIIFIKK